MSVSSLAVVELLEETVQQGLPIIILFVLLSNFKVRKLRSIPTPPMAALTEFSQHSRGCRDKCTPITDIMVVSSNYFYLYFGINNYSFALQ